MPTKKQLRVFPSSPVFETHLPLQGARDQLWLGTHIHNVVWCGQTFFFLEKRKKSVEARKKGSLLHKSWRGAENELTCL